MKEKVTFETNVPVRLRWRRQREWRWKAATGMRSCTTCRMGVSCLYRRQSGTRSENSK